MSSPSSSQPPPHPVPPLPSNSSSQDAPQQRSPNQSGTSNLYLVTFLATLFLLLFLSCAIILRSYILRRRYQRRLEEAMAAGLVLTPRAPGSRQTRFGVKPKIFDSWFINGDEKWVDVQPVAAQPIFVKRKCKDLAVTKSPDANQQPVVLSDPPSSAPTNTLGVRLRHKFRRHQEPSTPISEREDAEQPVAIVPAHATLCPCSQGPSHYKVRVEVLQVSVLIAMPCPNRAQGKDVKTSFDITEDENDVPLPELVLGVTRVQQRYRKGADEMKPTFPSAVHDDRSP